MTSAQGLNAAFLLPKEYVPAIPERTLEGLTSWHTQEGILRQLPYSEGTIVFEISNARAVFQRSQKALNQEMDRLRTFYGFSARETVASFLTNHPSISSVLMAAVPYLKEHFGPESILNLKVSSEDDDSQTLYAVVVWRGTAQTAAQAMESFVENWWLDQMTSNTTDLAFTYELA
jgi:hypothetical protein